VKPLYCASCDAPHDVDLAPDTGECVICGGPLIEDEKERGEVGPDAVASRMVEVVNDALAGAAVARGTTTRGVN
jgi:hypothetical protein